MNRADRTSYFNSDHVIRALSEWREVHGLEWPYQGSSEQQEHYRFLLDEYRVERVMEAA